MTYRIFYTDVPLPQEPDYSKLLPFEKDTEDLAITKMIELTNHGVVVWRIEGPNGFLLDRPAVKQMYFTKTRKWPHT